MIMKRMKTTLGAAAGASLLVAGAAGAISHGDIVKGAVDGATGAAEAKVDGAKEEAAGAVADEAAGAVGDEVAEGAGMMDKANQAIDHGQKTIQAGSDTMDAVKGGGVVEGLGSGQKALDSGSKTIDAASGLVGD